MHQKRYSDIGAGVTKSAFTCRALSIRTARPAKHQGLSIRMVDKDYKVNKTSKIVS